MRFVVVLFFIFLMSGSSSVYSHDENPMWDFIKSESSLGSRESILDRKGNYPIKGYGPLTNAAIFGYVDIVDELSTDKEILLFEGAAALHAASTMGWNGIVQLLLDRKVDVNSKANNGLSAVLGASQYGEYRLLCKLINEGGNVNYKKDKTNTALILAVTSGDIDTVEVVLQNGYLISDDGEFRIIKNMIENSDNGEIKDVLEKFLGGEYVSDTHRCNQ